VEVVSLMWVRFTVLVIVIMVIYDVQSFKVVLAPFFFAIAIALVYK